MTMSELRFNGLELELNKAEEYVQTSLGLKLERSRLSVYSSNQWAEFCKGPGFKGEGVYIPKALKAYILKDSPDLISNAFHELFGHGLFCEHSLIGQPLYSLQSDTAIKYLHENINSEKQPLGLASQNFWNYEGFALWMESILCEESENQKVWENKKQRLPDNYKSAHQFFSEAENTLGRFGFMCQMGFPHTNPADSIINSVKRITGNLFSTIDLILLYGSQKPNSDIDLFVISSQKSKDYYNGWLDIYWTEMSDFKQKLAKLDISVLDPLFSGTILYGPPALVQKFQNDALQTKISTESISYALERAYFCRASSKHLPSGSRLQKSAESYALTYTKSANAMSRGNKIFTKKEALE